jgi:DnaJ-class molecular chaperone
MDLIEFPCPDCTTGLGQVPLFDIFKPTCPTCNGKRKVLVKREDIIKLGGK